MAKTGPKTEVDDDAFIELYRALGPAEVTRRLGYSNFRVAIKRKKRLEQRLHIDIRGPNRINDPRTQIPQPKASHRLELSVSSGHIIIASDLHLWPGDRTTVFKALLKLSASLRPLACVLNGDVMDFPKASRHAVIGWERRPELIEEIEWAQSELHVLSLRLPKGCRRIWTLGNHDGRFESRIANLAPEYAKVHGVHLRDHFPDWEPAWSTWVNGDTVIKHRFKGGIHAAHNNTLWSGKSIITGHLHSAQVRPLTDYNGTRYGVDTGCVAEPTASAFVNYTEDNPLNWRSSFCVLTFTSSKLMIPELVLKWDDQHVQFRGELIRV